MSSSAGNKTAGGAGSPSGIAITNPQNTTQYTFFSQSDIVVATHGTAGATEFSYYNGYPQNTPTITFTANTATVTLTVDTGANQQVAQTATLTFPAFTAPAPIWAPLVIGMPFTPTTGTYTTVGTMCLPYPYTGTYTYSYYQNGIAYPYYYADGSQEPSASVLPRHGYRHLNHGYVVHPLSHSIYRYR